MGKSNEKSKFPSEETFPPNPKKNWLQNCGSYRKKSGTSVGVGLWYLEACSLPLWNRRVVGGSWCDDWNWGVAFWFTTWRPRSPWSPSLSHWRLGHTPRVSVVQNSGRASWVRDVKHTVDQWESTTLCQNRPQHKKKHLQNTAFGNWALNYKTNAKKRGIIMGADLKYCTVFSTRNLFKP